MRILFDTNVVLDVLLDREPHVATSLLLMKKVELGELEGVLCATSITTVDYVVGRVLNAGVASSAIRSLLSLYDISRVDRATLALALDSNFDDFEDAVLHQSGVGAGVDGIVTRNGRDFKQAELPIYSPVELQALLQSS